MCMFKKLNTLIYGDDINIAMRLDELRREGLISEDMERHVYRITIDGRSFLASGGYTAEAKKSKNDVYAFNISLAAIAISLISLIVTIADRLSRP